MTNPSDKKLILVVDDEPRMTKFVRMNLELEGYRVAEASNGLEALQKVKNDLPDLVILDVKMPELDGFETLRLIRQSGAVPVIMLTVKAVLRRTSMPAPTEKTEIKVDDYLQIDFKKREVIVGGKHVKLRPTEYRLLYHLVNNAGYVITHDMLLAKVWGHEYRDESQYVRLYVNYLRQKIEPDPANPKYILTEHGVGYRFVDFKDGRRT